MSHTKSKDGGHSGRNQQQPLPSYREGSSASHRGNEFDPKLLPQTSRKRLRDHHNTRGRWRLPAQTEASSGSSAEYQALDAKLSEDARLMVMRNRQTLEYVAPIKDWIEIENSLDVLATQTISDLKPEVEMLKKEKEQAEKRNKELQEALRVTRKEKRDAEKRKEELQEALRAAKKEKEEAEDQRNRVENVNRELQEALRAAVQKCWELNTCLGDSLETQRMLKEQLAGMIPIRLQGEAGGTTGASKRGFLASIPWNKYREAVEEYKHSHRNLKER